ncbi:MAG: transposase [Cycloclasticus sp. symbiont of Bathymodiolus heckerae]|nr:MAG: transposase [Cycloclasticus sp. symbiont of Bathymodiolus heckerae]
MAIYSQEFKVQSVEKALSKRDEQTLNDIADDLRIGYSTLQRWIRLAKENKLENPETNMSTEKSPQSWTKAQRLEAVMDCHSLNDEQLSSYCRENGIYPHHVKEWKLDFLSENQVSGSASRQDQKKLKQENKRLQKELNRKDRALAETAALLVLSKKCQAIWGEKEVD